LSTRLPIGQAEPLSADGLVTSAVAVCLEGSFELNGIVETPVAGWRRLRRGGFTELSRDGAISEEVVDHAAALRAENVDEASLIERIRAAFASYARSQRDVRSSVVELSGGYDSTLAAAAARSPTNEMRGISMEFPFYEFRFEAELQRAVGVALEIPRTAVDGRTVLPYSAWSIPPRFEEPSVFVTGIRHAEVVAQFAVEHGAERLYVGHGGDHLFAVDLTDSEAASLRLSKAAFSARAWRAIAGAFQEARQPLWRRRSTGTFVYDARLDLRAKEEHGLTVRTPFTDVELFHTGLLWSRWNAKSGTKPDKSILVAALPHFLPEAVLRRAGKVAYDGVWMRAYAQNADQIAGVIDKAGPILEHVGVSPRWILARVRDLAAWREVPHNDVLAIYAIAVWLAAWGIDRVDAVRWSDRVGVTRC
jgi:asparagine synthetase B (glutamine-hydrolysing)